MTQASSFPAGFDRWCEQDAPAINGRRSKKFPPQDNPSGADVAKAQEFVKEVIDRNSKWASVIVNTSYGKPSGWEFVFERQEACLNDEGWIEATQIISMRVTGHCQAFSVENLVVKTLTLKINSCIKPVRLVNCHVASLDLGHPEDTRFDLELDRCWIGQLILAPECLGSFRMIGGGVASIDCPSAEKASPFKGAVSFNEVLLPASEQQSSLFRGPQAYRNLQAHLKKHDNNLMANRLRAAQLHSERFDERGLAKITNWLYYICSDYGLSPGRPLWGVLGIYVCAVVMLWVYAGIVCPSSTESCLGLYEGVPGEAWGHFARSVLLPIQSMVNPFGFLTDSRRIMPQPALWVNVVLMVQGVISDGLLIMTAFSIRRRYKTE